MRGVWNDRLRPLMAEPGRWARVRDYGTWAGAAVPASRLRTGKINRPPGDWEFAGRTMGDGVFALFARYLGPGDGTP